MNFKHVRFFEKLQFFLQNGHALIDEFQEHFSNEMTEEEKVEKELIENVLQKTQGKRKDAAKQLGISERTLYRRIKKYNI